MNKTTLNTARALGRRVGRTYPAHAHVAAICISGTLAAVPSNTHKGHLDWTQSDIVTGGHSGTVRPASTQARPDSLNYTQSKKGNE